MTSLLWRALLNYCQPIVLPPLVTLSPQFLYHSYAAYMVPLVRTCYTNWIAYVQLTDACACVCVRYAGIGSTLTPGRSNGFLNMMKVGNIQSIYLSINQSINLSINLSIYLSINQSINHFRKTVHSLFELFHSLFILWISLCIYANTVDRYGLD